MRYGTAAVTVLAVAAAVWLWQRDRGPDLDPPAVLAQVRQLNQLATVNYTIQKVVGIREQKRPVGSESILLIVQANVQAGVDLANLQAQDVSVRRDGGVVVRLPEPRILTVALDENETKVWDRQKTWWAIWIPYSLDLEQRARQAGIEAVSKAALDAGILKHAEQNAASSIKALLELAGVREVRVIPYGAT